MANNSYNLPGGPFERFFWQGQTNWLWPSQVVAPHPLADTGQYTQTNTTSGAVFVLPASNDYTLKTGAGAWQGTGGAQLSGPGQSALGVTSIVTRVGALYRR